MKILVTGISTTSGFCYSINCLSYYCALYFNFLLVSKKVKISVFKTVAVKLDILINLINV